MFSLVSLLNDNVEVDYPASHSASVQFYVVLADDLGELRSPGAHVRLVAAGNANSREGEKKIGGKK